MKKIPYLYIAVMLLAGLSVVVQAVARNTQAKPVASKTVTETDNTSVNATPDNTPVLTLSNESNGTEEQEAAPKGFSISSTQQVYFAKGNLQKVGNSWQFAEHQYDYFGENQTNDHRDMFSFDDSYPYTSPDGWYCLSIEQWDYMLTQRSVSNNLSNGARYTMATLNLGNSTVKGMIIFPDDYTHPSGTGFVAGTFNGASNYTATVGLEGWVLMEKAGCVFLPAAGYKSIGYTWYGVNDEGCYMSTTPYSSTGGYYDPYFRTSEVGVYETSSQSTWSSVRLVSNNPPDDEAGLTRSGEVSAYDGTRADFLTVAGKLSRYPRLSKAGMPLHYAPIVTTDSVPVSTNTATVYGNIVFNGWYDQLTAQGFQLSTTSDFSNATDYPFTPVNPYVECDQPCAANVYSKDLTGLIAGTIYYVRAYARNEAGITYAEPITFIFETGEGCPGSPFVLDHQNNKYSTVQIGYQCWTRENMRCTTLPSGRTMTLGYVPSQGTSNASYSYVEPYYYDCSLSDTILYRGYLYNWAAALDTAFSANSSDSYVKRQGICPKGWHVPSMDEWNYMLTYVMAHGNTDHYGCDNDSTKITKALSYDTTRWYSTTSSCAPGNDPSTNNLTQFSAYPANYFAGSGTNVLHVSSPEYVRFWTSSTYNSNNSSALYIGWDYYESQVRNGYNAKSGGFSVRCLRDTTGLRLPTVSIISVDSVTQETAKVVCEVTNMGGTNEIYERGICWSLDTLPTINNYKLVDETGEGLGEFISRIQYLTPGATYHVRAYATNFEGVGYSADSTITMEVPANRCPGTPTVTDHEGNVYNTVQIGYQCWTRENMRCTTLPSGTEIGLGRNKNGSYIRCGDTLALYYDDYASTVPLEQGGYLYNWYAVMDTVSKTASIPYVSFEKRRGICPEGWHVPSMTEWDTLVNYMSRQSEYMCREDAYSKYFANALASKYWWANPGYSDSCYVGVSPEKNNASGMSMIPTGYWGTSSMSMSNRSQYAYFWSSTLYSNSSSYNYGFRLRYDVNRVSSRSDYGDQFSRGSAFPVRCLRDTTGLHVPTVTASVDTVTSVSAMFNASVTKDGGATVTECGFCYSTNPNPTVNDLKVASGSGLGDFTDTVFGLVPNTTYYFRAYARNYEGVGYSDEMVITTPEPANSCPGTPTVTDHEGNVYNTVQIGNQCWTRENMRCKTTPKHPNVNLMTTCINWNCKSDYEPHVYSAFNFSSCTADPSMLNSYGYFYNWPAAIDTVGTDCITASFLNRRGICPEGWHVPSTAEWDTLLAYVGRQEDYRCNNYSDYIARALADQSSWTSYSCNCCPGGDLTQNNATGFTAVATGYVGYSSGYSYVKYESEGSNAYFWSSTHYNEGSNKNFSYYYSMYNNSSSVYSSYSGGNSDGYSVRCIKDKAGAVEKTNPTVITTGVSEIGTTSVKFTGEVVSDGNATVTQRGFCWGSNVSNLDTNHTHAAYGTGEGVFEATIADFTPGYTYYMRAYAVNSLGITYGEPDTFTMTNDFHVDVLPYVSDFSDSTSWALNDNGNEYNCYWMVGENNGYYAGQSLFVTSDGTTASCNNSSYSSYYLSAEKYLKMPASDSVHVEFDVLAGGYYDYHYMKAFLAPVNYTFTSSSNYFGSSYSTNAVDFQKYMLTSSNCYYLSMTNGKMLHVSVNMPNPAPNDTCKLAFLWNKGSYSYITQPGAIVANVLVSTVSAATDSVMGVTSNSANVFGKVAAFGDETVTERGVCWATHARPTASDNHLTSSVDTFSVNITGLVFNTEYYVRAYAKTSDGITVYGDEILFRTKMAAECYSPVPYNTNFTDGNKWVVNNGDADNYWTMGTPTNGDTSMLYITNDEQFAGQAGYKTSTSYTVVTAEKPLLMPTADSVYVTFDTKIGGESSDDYLKVFLAPESFEIPAYYSSSSPSNSISHYDSSRYAMNFSDYKLYSEQLPYPYIFNRTQGIFVHIICRMANPAPGDTAKLVFLWRNDGSGGAQPGAMISNLTVSVDAPAELDRSCPDAPTVTDEEGNTYGTVLIGSQCWMSENLRSTKRGTYTVQNVIYPNEDASLVATYGLLYQWADAMAGASGSSASPSGVQGLCPDGWHVPSNIEWSEMATEVSNTFGSSHVAKALAYKEGWLSSSNSDNYPSYRPEYNNASGFSWRPAGWNNGGTFSSYGSEANCWTTTEYYSSNAYRAKIAYNQNSLNQGTFSKEYGYSLRCVKGAATLLEGYIMPANSTGTLTTCDTLIYDEGGAFGDYSTNNDSYLTIYPATPGMAVSISGTVTTETGYDFLYIYDGTDVNGDLLESYSGSSTITNVVSSTGPLTIHFHSDNSTVYGGFALTASCVDACLAPSGLTVSNIGTSSAELSWTPNGNETYWLVRYKEASSSDWDNEDFVSTPSYDLSNLTPLTAYEVSVQSVCGSELSNFASISFSTANCEPSEQCTYTFLLMDSYGDGWNGGYLEVVQGGIVVNTLEALNHQVSNIQTIDTVTMMFCKNISTSLVWHSGQYDSEVGITLLGSGDEQLYSINGSDALPYDTLFTFTTNCDNVTPSTFTCGSTFIDARDGIEYNTVLIGSQCWMKENLRTTKDADGNDLVDGNNQPLYSYPANNDNNVSIYGLLYSWNVMMNGENSSEENPSGVRGICPEGWHVPSLAEWNELIDTTNAQYPDCATKALADTFLWNYTPNDCAPGNDQDNNNSTGFSARPAGFNYGSGYNSFGYSAEFWSATQANVDEAHFIEINFSATNVYRDVFPKDGYRAVRCVRGASGSGTTVGVPPTVGELIMINDQGVDKLQFSIIESGSSTIEEYGFCMSQYDEEPTSNDWYWKSSGYVPGYPASSTISSLMNSIYPSDYQGPVYVRGYATNASGTAYTNVMEFNIGQ